MKILFALNKLNIGGPQKVVAFLANKLCKDHNEVCIITYSDAEPTIYLEDSVQWISIHYEAIVNNSKNILHKRIAQIPLVFTLRKKIRELNPDIVCVFTVSVLRIVELALIGCHYPIISSERGNPCSYSKSFRRKVTKAYKKCHIVVFQTEEARDSLDISNGIVIPNPAIKRTDGGKIKKTGIENLLLAAGRLEEEKGFAFLIECIEEVCKKIPCILRIYGSGTQETYLKRIIKEKNLEDTVYLCGESNYIFEINSDASIYILSSYTEGMPNVLIEAMLAGIPCIATNCASGGPGFLLDYGNRGDLVEVGDKDQMVEAIIKNLSTKKYVKERALRAMEIEKVLSPEKIYSQWINVFKSLV